MNTEKLASNLNDWNAGYEKGRDDYCCNQDCNQGRDCPLRKPKTMNAHELIQLLSKNTGEGYTPIRQAVDMLRQQADRIAELEKVSSKPVAWDDSRADEFVSSLYRKFKDWSVRGFTADDVTWCEVKAEVNTLLSKYLTHPVKQLSDEEINEIYMKCHVYPADGSMILNVHKFARAIIKECCGIIEDSK